MTKKTFNKTLSANDVGKTGGHQAGILIPKSEAEVLAFLPPLDPAIKNPDAWIECMDDGGLMRQFRFIYYNNKLHDPTGTRNEYRITHMTGYFRDVAASEGDVFEISRHNDNPYYNIRVTHLSERTLKQEKQITNRVTEELPVYRIKIRSGWRRVH